MTEKEFLTKCRKMIETARKGHGMCCEMQDGLNAELRDGRITHEEWSRRTEENEKRRAFFMEKLEWLGKGLDQLKKH